MADAAVTVRPATEADEAILRELWGEFEQEVPEPDGFEPETWAEEWSDTIRQIASGGVFLALDEDGPVGVVKMDEPKNGAMHIHLVYVRPRARRQGVSKQLLRACVEKARASGVATISLHVLLVNTAAHAVWRRLGFESISTFMAAPLDVLDDRLVEREPGEFGQAASQIGDRVVIVTLALFITRGAGSPTDLGLVLGAQALALVSLLLLGGVWADRLERHRVMISTDVVRATLHTLVAVLILTGTIRIWELVVIEFLFGAAMAFYQPAYSGPGPTDRPRGRDPGRARTEPDVRQRRISPRPRPGDRPRARRRRRRGIRPRRGDVRGECRAAAAGAPARSRRAARADRVGDRGPAHRMARGAVACLGVGDDRRVQRVLLCVFAQWYALAPSIARDVYGSAGVFGVLEATAGAGAVIGAVMLLRVGTRRARCAPG